jgi:hypothetical protein
MATDNKAKRLHERVRATRLGFFKGQRIKPGMTFTLDADKQFSAKWMVDVPKDTADTLAAMTHPIQRAGLKRTSRDIPELQHSGLDDRVTPAAAALPSQNDSVI